VPTTFQLLSSEDAPPEKQTELLALARAFAPHLHNPKTVVLQTNGPDKDPINGAFVTAHQLSNVFSSSPLAAPIRQDAPHLFGRVELVCDLRAIHSAIRFSPRDKTIYIHKPTFISTEADVEDHAVKAFGHMLHARLPVARSKAFNSNCSRVPYPAEFFGRTFCAWIRYLVEGDRRELNATSLNGTKLQAAERNTIVMAEATRYVQP
jgi:hypothetical protein